MSWLGVINYHASLQFIPSCIFFSAGVFVIITMITVLKKYITDLARKLDDILMKFDIRVHNGNRR